MRKYFLIVFNSLFILTLAVSTTSAKDETAIIKTTIYCDHCLKCETCGGKLKWDMSFKKGIKTIDIDEKAMTITVKFNPKKITLAELKETISKYGYDADDVKADSVSYSKLDECCKRQ